MRKVDLRESIESRAWAWQQDGSQARVAQRGPERELLRDAAGQAREFNNFMLPVDTGDGQAVFCWACETQADPMRYLRVPVDAEGRMDGFVRLRLALADPALREKAVRRYAAAAVDAKRPELARAAGTVRRPCAGAVCRRHPGATEPWRSWLQSTAGCLVWPAGDLGIHG